MEAAKRQKLEENPNPDGCQTFLERKKRWCRMTVAKGNRYCGEHSRERANVDTKTEPETINADPGVTPGPVLRIPCPLDPKHSVFTDRLQKHLKICNAREQPKPEFIKKDLNLGSEDESEEKDEPVKLSDLDIEYLKGLVDKVKKFYESIESDFHPQEQIQYHSNDHLNEELANPSYGQDTLKHLRQTSALIGSLERLELIQPKTCFVEFGAGKGQVSYYLANSFSATSESSVLLVDRASMRFKLDNKCEDRSTIKRIRADIADLDLRSVSGVQGKEQLVGISKHLCGAATDLAIRCMRNVSEPGQSQAMVIAVCCHHRCTWKSFVGKAEFQKHNLSAKDFGSIIKMVSWAVCGQGMSKERRKLVEDQEAGLVAAKDVAKNLPWSREEQEEIGYQCKRIIDYSRLQYLKANGFAEAGAFFYISKDVTLENLCIYARTTRTS